MSTPNSLDLPDGVRRTTIHTSRGAFAALTAVPGSGVCDRDAALLVPGYTGSKEDFLPILDLLADGSRQAVAIDMRGQFETPGADDADGYLISALAQDLLAVMRATGARHLLGHSFGGLVAREAILAGADAVSASTMPTDAGRPDAGLPEAGSANAVSVTLMSSGPGALTGARAKELRAMLAALGVTDDVLPDRAALAAGIAQIWQGILEPQGVASGTPPTILAFVGKRMLSNDPAGLVLMARHMLTAPDRTAELARLSPMPMLVLYGENDNAWSPAAQENMARRLDACRLCIPGAVHSPAIEAPATTAGALTHFWDAAEAVAARPPAAATGMP